MCTRQQKPRLGMIECGTVPPNRRVAGLASRSESSRVVIGLARRIKIGLMTIRALGRRSIIDSSGVAGGARGLRVGAREREVGPPVIELSVHPLFRGVALLAGDRESCRQMVRVRGIIVVRLMACGAFRARACEDAPAMAGRAGFLCMRSFQGKSRLRVVERRSLPLPRVVTRLARGRESGEPVFRVRRVVIRLLMAGRAGERQAGIDAASMTCGAVRLRVVSGQRELRAGVLEDSALPLPRRVAGFARGLETSRPVIRLSRRVVGGFMARQTPGRRPVVHAGAVARRALSLLMGPREQKLGAIVIETGRVPPRRVVTHRAVCREVALSVLGLRCALKIPGVARHTIAPESPELLSALRPRLVARLALERRVGPRQRKRGPQVGPRHLGAIRKAARAVAVLTLCPERPFVNIGVASDAAFLDLGEGEGLVARSTAELLVSLAQRETVPAVVEGR